VIDASSEQIYQYLNFDKIDEYKEIADKVAA
jgi:aconitate hydratase 2/2-methylisocitrate dehydratase